MKTFMQFITNWAHWLIVLTEDRHMGLPELSASLSLSWTIPVRRIFINSRRRQ